MMKRLLLITVLGCQLLIAQQIKFFNTYGHGIYDSGEGVWTTNDTGYVVGGITTQTGSNGTDMLIYKVDSLGNLQWYKNIGIDNSIEGAKSITCGKNGSEFILAGYQNKFDTSAYNFYIAKTDFNGDTIWTRSYGGADWDMAYSVDTLQDSTYVIAGETYSFGNGNSDMYVMRVGNNGDTLWTRTFGGSEDDYARYVFTDKYNRIIVIGSTYSFGAGGADVYIVHLNAMGDTIWTRTYGTAVDEFGVGGDMFFDLSWRMSYAFTYSQYDPSSSSLESRFFRGDSISGALVYDVPWFDGQPPRLYNMTMRWDARGKYYVTGSFESSGVPPTDIYIHRSNYAFSFGTTHLQYFQIGEQHTNDIRKCFDNGMVVTGSTTYFGPGPTSTFILKTDSLLSAPATPLVNIYDEPEINVGIYPNPITEQVVYINAENNITSVKIFDMSGRVIIELNNESSEHITVLLPNLTNGLYIVEVQTSKGTGRKKLLVAE